MKKELYNLVSYRAKGDELNAVVYGKNKKIAKMKNIFINQVKAIKEEEGETDEEITVEDIGGFTSENPDTEGKSSTTTENPTE